MNKANNNANSQSATSRAQSFTTSSISWRAQSLMISSYHCLDEYWITDQLREQSRLYATQERSSIAAFMWWTHHVPSFIHQI